MSERLIAIVGSADPNRTDYWPALRDRTTAHDAAETLGEELAKAGFGIVVFASSADFIENRVVKGYVRSGEAKPRSIQKRYPRVKDPAIHGDFPEEATHSDLFQELSDTHEFWEVSYYNSIHDVTGMLMIGGGGATLTIGLMALGNRVPLVPIACFGAKAEIVWTLAKDSPLLTRRRHEQMGSRWTSGLAAAFVESLAEQATKRRELQDAPRVHAMRRSIVAFVAGLVAVVLLGIGTFSDTTSRFVFATCFFGVPLFSGVAGALARSMLDYLRGSITSPGQSFWVTPVLGMTAGVVSAVAFVLAQLTTLDVDSLGAAIAAGNSGLDRLILFEFVIAIVAGLTFDAVFGKLESVDAMRTDVL